MKKKKVINKPENLLFELEPIPLKNIGLVEKTCRTCANSQPWECGGSGRVIQYCGVRKSKRTVNGLLRIKVTNPACELYKEE